MTNSRPLSYFATCSKAYVQVARQRRCQLLGIFCYLIVEVDVGCMLQQMVLPVYGCYHLWMTVTHADGDNAGKYLQSMRCYRKLVDSDIVSSSSAHAEMQAYIQVSSACLVIQVLHLALSDHDWIFVPSQDCCTTGNAFQSLVV